MKKRLFLKTLLTLAISAIYTFSQLQLTVSALSQDQKTQQIRGSTYYNVDSCDTSGGSAGGSVTTSTPGETTEPKKAVQKVVWDTLTAGGIDDMHTAAVMGNISSEGVWDPTNIEDPAGTTKDRSVIENLTGQTQGYGLIGWTPGKNLLKAMGDLGIGNEKPYTAETQAAVILGQIQGKTSLYDPSVGREFLGKKTIEDATTFYEGGSGFGFERPADPGATQADRIAAAKKFLRQFGGTTGTASAPVSSGGGGVCCPGSGGGGGTNSSGPVTLTGKTNAEKVYNYLQDYAGLTDNQAAGAVGAMMLESGGNTLNIDPTAENPSSHAYGIAQWLGSRETGLESFAKQKGGDKSDLAIQVQYLQKEMESNINGYVNSDYKKKKTLRDAVEYWTNYFEGLVGDSSQQLYDQRLTNARTLLDSVDGGSGGSTSTSSTGSGSCSCEAPTSSDASGSLDSTLQSLANKNGGKTSITAQSIGGEPKGNANGDVQMPTRSSYKLYTAYATLRAIEAGKISWSSHVSAGGWSGSVSDTMEQMIVYSNNDAAESLRLNRNVGTPQQVTQMLQNDLGLSDKTIMGSGSASDPKGSNSRSTSNDFAKFLVLLYHQKLKGVSKDSDYNKLIGFMKRATTDGSSARDGIVAGVGSGTEVADKPGWAPAGVDAASNDVGIVYLDSNPYVLAILTDKPDQWDGVAKIAKAVNGAMGGGTASGNCSGAVAGDLQATVKNYAWPDYHSAPYVKMEPDYETAVKKAQAQGRYVGGNRYPGVDCGGFVTTAMIDSQFEPSYNSSGKGGFTGSPSDPATQWGWLDKNWQKINPGSTKDLQPGDVAISSSHTYMYVGKIPGFNSVVASASLDSRAPMAGSEAPADPNFSWYRKK